MFKKILCRMLLMQPSAWRLFLGGFQLTGLMLFLAVIALFLYQELGDHYYQKLCLALVEQGQLLLLGGTLASVIVEDMAPT